jgi:hypothetical protein
MTIIPVVQNDYGYLINFTCQNADGSVFDMTGITNLYFRVQRINSTQLMFSNAMSVVSETSGTCYYQVTSTDFTLPGVYNAQIKAVFSGQVITFPNIQVDVSSYLPSNSY